MRGGTLRDYDAQLLESVAVRRRRLRHALLFGPDRTRRTFDENLVKVVAGLCVAAVLCAGTVGFSYLRSRLQEQERKAAESQVAAPGPGTAPVPAEWVGAKVTFAMLRRALAGAGVPAGLYVLPDRPGGSGSHYVVARDADGYSGGVVEFGRARIAAEFPTEDEACRWLYGELVVPDGRPVRALDADAERAAVRGGAALDAEVRDAVAAAGGTSVVHRLRAGTLVDAFGNESGSVLSPFGTPFARRGLPAEARGYHRYRVARPFDADASLSAGGGARFTLNAGLFPNPPALLTVRWLVRTGYLDPVTGAGVPR
ncbi:TNT domain-containing protein [Actinomadura rifamycini]|uniref:TNT domain-containing protein n=1 Tax=Actinomadura rifamycini TaxID=31962 RepID=UPI0004103AD3|nr:TNT domain-containing protein [Actinomadura rifamycini]